MDTTSPEKQIKILFLASEPSDTGKLRLGKELQEIKNRLSTNKSFFDLQERHAVKPDDVQQTILNYKPHIVHFSGHGEETGEICFEDENGKSKVIPPDALAELFSLVKDHTKCVVVNTCYSDKQAEAIARYVPIVVGTRKEISDSAAIKFSIGFYTALASAPDLSQQSLRDAYTSGRIAIRFENLPEDLTPIMKEGLPEVKFSSEVDTALISISKPKGYVFQALIKGLTLTGKKMDLNDETVEKIIKSKINKLESYNKGIEEYEKYLKEILRDEYPLSEQSMAALLQLQNGLSLNNEDVATIRDKVLSNPNLNSPEEWFDRGRGQTSLGDYEKAVEFLSKAIEKDSDYSGAYYERGYNYDKMQEYDLAIEDFSKAIEFDNKWELASNLGLAYHSRGLCYFNKPTEDEFKKKEYMSQALKDWSECINLNADMPDAYFNRGLVYEYIGDLNKAISEFKKSYEIDKKDKTKISTAIRLTRCYSILGNTEETKDWAKKGLVNLDDL